MTWDFFYRQLCAGLNVGEVEFYFKNDETKTEHFLGYMPMTGEEKSNPTPYWIGLSDIEGGCAFASAEALVHAPVYGGRSLREIWDEIEICTIEGVDAEDWLRFMEHCE